MFLRKALITASNISIFFRRLHFIVKIFNQINSGSNLVWPISIQLALRTIELLTVKAIFARILAYFLGAIAHEKLIEVITTNQLVKPISKTIFTIKFIA